MQTTQGANLFFQVISTRHERKSSIITTNLTFSEWGKIFDSTTVATAIADRLVYNSEILIMISNHKNIKIACYSINFCDLRSNKFDPNLCAYLGKLFRPRSFLNAVSASSINRYSFPVYLGEKWKRVYCLILALPANLPA